MQSYNVADVERSYNWFGHKAATELVALHPEYKPGRENLEWNKSKQAFPRTAYARDAAGVLRFVSQHHGKRMVCMGLNERPTAFKNERGYARAAFESEIERSSNLLLDFDIEARAVSDAQGDALGRFMRHEISDYFQDLGFQVPALAFTGRGYHVLGAYPAIKVDDLPDISQRLRKFGTDLASDFEQELERLETRLDHTHDLRRMTRVYGTAKPTVGIVSEFYGNERIEDEALRDYLVTVSLADTSSSACREPAYGPSMLAIRDQLPPLFRNLLSCDEKLNQLWHGNGKPSGSDASGSGYDFSLARRLLVLGYRDIDEIATVLALRPGGSFQNGKGEDYIRRTIGNALKS